MIPKSQDPDGHAWSGWPGAICLRCGIDDERELCAAVCDWVDRCMDAEQRGLPLPPPCEVHVNPKCASDEDIAAGGKR